jgi:hypothetical protein
MDAQIAVYIDFDNIIMSRYDELHGAQAWRDDRAGSRSPSPFVQSRLAESRVDLVAIMDYAASFGTVSISRAYANWATPVNASYASQMMRSSIDLVQMFPLTRTKNGADIRLVIDVIDDLSAHRHITHVLVVAGDSDYVSLAQRCKRLGRRVIGVGAFRSVGQYWEAACDEFRYYGNLLTVASADDDPGSPLDQSAAVPEGDLGALLVKAARLLHAQSSGEWIAAGGLKNFMTRLDPAFDENAGGFPTFTAFLRSRPDLVFVRITGNTWVRLRELGPAADSAESNLGGQAAAAAVTDTATGDIPQAADPMPPAERAETGAAGSAVQSGHEQLVKELVSALPVVPALSQSSVVNRLRRHLRFPGVDHITPPLEDLAVHAVRTAWQLCDPGSGRVYVRLPFADIRDALISEGANLNLAKRATSVALSAPMLLRDSGMVLQPSPEMTNATDEQIRASLRAGFLERIRNAEEGSSASLAEVVEAIHGSDALPDQMEALIAEYAVFDAWPGWRRLGEAIGPLLMPAPVLWDVAAAMVAVGSEVELPSADALAAALGTPLHEMDRDVESVPFDAAYLSLVGGGAIVRRDDRALFVLAHANPDTPDVAAVIVKAWIDRCAQDGLAVAPEALNRLALPDRHQILWRGWVLDILRTSGSASQP